MILSINLMVSKWHFRAENKMYYSASRQLILLVDKEFSGALYSRSRYANEDLYNCRKSVRAFRRDLQIWEIPQGGLRPPASGYQVRLDS